MRLAGHLPDLCDVAVPQRLTRGRFLGHGEDVIARPDGRGGIDQLDPAQAAPSSFEHSTRPKSQLSFLHGGDLHQVAIVGGSYRQPGTCFTPDLEQFPADARACQDQHAWLHAVSSAGIERLNGRFQHVIARSEVLGRSGFDDALPLEQRLRLQAQRARPNQVFGDQRRGVGRCFLNGLEAGGKRSGLRCQLIALPLELIQFVGLKPGRFGIASQMGQKAQPLGRPRPSRSAGRQPRL